MEHRTIPEHGAGTDYDELGQSLRVISEDTAHRISILSNASALIWETLPDINWCGFYLMHEGNLILGPFQGKIACTVIEPGKGVCGAAAARNETVRVQDVHTFDGHIACDSASNSEIVVPIHRNGEIYGVLDIDSPLFARFDEKDEKGLESVVRVLEEVLR
ncbi:MAG: GAF domain-containing protein [Clostridia bacterium]|nr:GAF domain-containing protein [Clostridia bacterium]